jgi:hypothetical protein
MSYTVKDKKKINFDSLLELSNIFNIYKIETSYFEHVLEFYDTKQPINANTNTNINNKQIIAMINYCLIPSMKGHTRLFIRNLYFLDKNNLNDIIKSLCEYCKKNNLSIKTTLDNNKFDEDCKKALMDNDFKGNDVLYYINH